MRRVRIGLATLTLLTLISQSQVADGGPTPTVPEANRQKTTFELYQRYWRVRCYWYRQGWSYCCSRYQFAPGGQHPFRRFTAFNSSDISDPYCDLPFVQGPFDGTRWRQDGYGDCRALLLTCSEVLGEDVTRGGVSILTELSKKRRLGCLQSSERNTRAD